MVLICGDSLGRGVGGTLLVSGTRDEMMLSLNDVVSADRAHGPERDALATAHPPRMRDTVLRSVEFIRYIQEAGDGENFF